mmetsp:Transcript_19947/g.64940  ORF Transcript_19947/g.64940 Transcript_19947/m.64940 type:complete len:201 (+) Transcript_19947:1772-2374(+)
MSMSVMQKAVRYMLQKSRSFCKLRMARIRWNAATTSMSGTKRSANVTIVAIAGENVWWTYLLTCPWMLWCVSVSAWRVREWSDAMCGLKCSSCFAATAVIVSPKCARMLSKCDRRYGGTYGVGEGSSSLSVAGSPSVSASAASSPADPSSSPAAANSDSPSASAPSATATSPSPSSACRSRRVPPADTRAACAHTRLTSR